MNQQPFNLVHTLTQGRETEDMRRQSLLARPHRSLSTGLSQLSPAGLRFVPLRLCLHLLVFLLVLMFASVVAAQEVAETIRIKTRVVFLDALVKDKRTNLPISNLTPENFEVFDNGKPRTVSYFTREGQARKPLALVLILDLRADGAGRFMKKPEILKAMEEELAKLPPGDEVAIMAMDMGEDEMRFWLTEFTSDRAKIAAALARVPGIADDNPEVTSDLKPIKSTAATASGDAEGKPDDVIKTETVKGKSGGTVTRTVLRDGTIHVKRVSGDGKVTVEANDIYDLSAAVIDTISTAEVQRPNSQLSVVWVSDGIAPIFFEDRDATEQLIIRNNMIFNSLTVELRTLFKFLVPVGKPIAGWLGVSLYGSAKYLAQRSGGEAVKVSRTKDYGTGLSRIIGNLTARYSLGFALAEDEVDDGRMHSLEVRVKAKDEKGKNRKLLVSSRQGYYMPTGAPKEAASKEQ